MNDNLTADQWLAVLRDRTVNPTALAELAPKFADLIESQSKRIASLETMLGYAEDAANKGDLARSTADAMQQRIAELNQAVTDTVALNDRNCALFNRRLEEDADGFRSTIGELKKRIAELEHELGVWRLCHREPRASQPPEAALAVLQSLSSYLGSGGLDCNDLAKLDARIRVGIDDHIRVALERAAKAIEPAEVTTLYDTDYGTPRDVRQASTRQQCAAAIRGLPPTKNERRMQCKATENNCRCLRVAGHPDEHVFGNTHGTAVETSAPPASYDANGSPVGIDFTEYFTGSPVTEDEAKSLRDRLSNETGERQ